MVDWRKETRTNSATNGTFHIQAARRKYSATVYEPGGTLGHFPPVGAVGWTLEVSHPAYQDLEVRIRSQADKTLSSTNEAGPKILRDIMLIPRNH